MSNFCVFFPVVALPPPPSNKLTFSTPASVKLNLFCLPSPSSLPPPKKKKKNTFHLLPTKLGEEKSRVSRSFNDFFFVLPVANLEKRDNFESHIIEKEGREGGRKRGGKKKLFSSLSWRSNKMRRRRKLNFSGPSSETLDSLGKTFLLCPPKFVWLAAFSSSLFFTP